MEALSNAKSAAELTKIPVEHLLCATTIYHTLALMNPEDVLRPSHFGMLAQAVDSLEQIVIGPGDEEEDDALPLDDPFNDEIHAQADEPQPVAAPEGQGVGTILLSALRSAFPQRSTRE